MRLFLGLLVCYALPLTCRPQDEVQEFLGYVAHARCETKGSCDVDESFERPDEFRCNSLALELTSALGLDASWPSRVVSREQCALLLREDQADVTSKS